MYNRSPGYVLRAERDGASIKWIGENASAPLAQFHVGITLGYRP